jgi:V/A-type H+/Na+-transporting ATPase subunit C
MGMINIVQYAGVNAKVKALMGKMLTREDYQALLRMDTVQSIFDYLYYHTNYSDDLEDLVGLEIHRRQFEHTLKKSFVEDYEVIYRYLTGNTKKFFKFLFEKFEIEDLKMLLRTILIEHDREYLKENMIYLGVHTDISLDKLAGISSIEDLLNVFSGTKYYDTLKRFAGRYEQDRNLFPIEMTLDFNYFTGLEKMARKLSKDSYHVVRDILGTQVDLLNIQWIYRIKRFYNLELNEIKYYTLPYNYRLSEKELIDLIQIDNPDEIFNYLNHTKYNMLFSVLGENKGLLFEKYFFAYLLHKAEHLKLTGIFSIGQIIAYVFLKEYEIRDLITIIEGVRYSLNSDEIRNYLIRDKV